MEEMNEEEMFVLVAPDGSPQVSTMAPEYSMCCAMVELMASKGVGKSLGTLFQLGFEILLVKVTIVQVGNAESAFQKGKLEL